MNVAQFVSGIFFLLIIVTNVVADRFGYQTFSDLEPDKQLHKIVDSPQNFRIHFSIILFEHILLIAVALSLFTAFSGYSLFLAIAWTVFRSSEGLLQIYFKKDYRQLPAIAENYRTANENEKKTMAESTLHILETKNTVFTIAQVLFSAGTLCYSVLFFVYAISPVYISLFGIVAASIYGLGSIVKLLVNNKTVWNIGGLLILVYELGLGIWLIINSFSASQVQVN